MTHPFSCNWEQPDPADILVDDEHALMTTATWEQLPEYSSTLPTGVYEGKMWKRIEDPRYNKGASAVLFCWYGASDKGPGLCSINSRKVLLV